MGLDWGTHHTSITYIYIAGGSNANVFTIQTTNTGTKNNKSDRDKLYEQLSITYIITVGYNEKYPSGLRKVTCWPPFNITFALDTFTGRPNPFAATPI